MHEVRLHQVVPRVNDMMRNKSERRNEGEAKELLQRQCFH